MHRISRILAISAASVLLLSLSFTAGCVFSSGLNIALLNQAWAVITSNYVVPSKASADVLNEGAARGMVQSLNDPYSTYLSPGDYQIYQSYLRGSFSGIGATVGLNKDKLPVILSPIVNSPAAKAGIKTGDVILAINGRSTQGLSLTEVILLIRGDSGTAVKLLILREGETNPAEISVVRATIESPNVTSRMIGDIAYIDITSFSQNTNDELNAVLAGLNTSTKGIVLDLRDNPGGNLVTEIDVASHFIKDGTLVTLVDNKGNRVTQPVRPNGVFTSLQMVVLVNQNSASASEILSGDLQDYKRATIAGTVTLGKGSYDAFFQLADNSAIYLTIGRWLTPTGKEIEGKGITPDITLTQTGDDAIQWAVDYLNKPKTL
jgi:carboxyl-terminal processing protease